MPKPADQHTLDKKTREELAIAIQQVPGEFQIYTILAEEIVKKIEPLITKREQEMLEFVIGEDEPVNTLSSFAEDSIHPEVRNGLKSDQRQRAKEWKDK